MASTRREQPSLAVSLGLATFLLLGACVRAPAPVVAPSAGESSGEHQAGAPETPSAEFVLATSTPRRVVRDLEEIRNRGELRFIMHGSDPANLPREQSARARDLAMARTIAGELGVRARFVLVPEEAGLDAALVEGLGDVLLMGSEPDAASDPPGVAHTGALRSADEVVVVTRGRKNTPRRSSELASLRVAVRSSSHAARTLAALHKKGAPTESLPETLDDESALGLVGSGAREATVVYRDVLAGYREYAHDVEEAFVLREAVPLAWAVRADCRQLLTAMNQLITQQSMIDYQSVPLGGDLAEILRRKVLRVAMLNNGASYFIYRGQEVGFQYDLAALWASRLGVRLQVVVPKEPADLVRLVRERRVDLAPVSLFEGALDDSLASTVPFIHADQVVVQPAGERPFTSVSDLRGRSVHVRTSSAYDATLRLLLPSVPGLQVVAAPEDAETEDLIAMVGHKTIPLTVANSILLGAELAHREDVQGSLALAKHQPLAYAVRKDCPELLARMDKLIRRELERPTYREIYAKYFSKKDKMQQLRAEDSGVTGQLSPYDDLIRSVAAQHGVDWRMIAAQAYQESRFDPKARSWVGALGLLQVMPRTGQELGYSNLTDPENNVRAGVKYLTHLIDSTEAALPLKQRVRFALAAYNAGMGHVIDARVLAMRRGLDPNRWFGNVEQAMLLLEQPQYYRQARSGYCRGSEPVAYVSRIQAKYDAYVSALPLAGPSLQGEGD